MPGETKNQVSLTRASLSKAGRAKSKFLSVLALVLSLAGSRALAGEIRVVLSGTGSGVKEYDDPEGWWQRVSYTAVASLDFRPQYPVAQGEYFYSDRADVTGSIRFYGVAEDHYFGATEIWDFDVTENYNLVGKDVYTYFLKSNGSVDYIGTSLPYAAGSGQPEIYGMKFEGVSGILTNFVDLGSLWWFNDFYPIPATAALTGNESSLSGTVADPCSVPIGGATVKLTAAGFSQTLQTDANGQFQASAVPPGPLTIALSATGYESWSSTKLLAAFSSVNVALRMTNYPVVLVYGWNGTPANWDLIKTYLEMDCFNVHILQYDDSLAPVPAAALLSAEIASVLGSAGATKVNLIGHSYGGIVARHFIEEMGQSDKVENLVMIATPNHGSRLADYVAGTLVTQPQAGLVEYFFDFYSTLFRADRTWGSTLALTTVNNFYLDNLNLLFGSRLPGLGTRYFVVVGTQPYPPRFTSHQTFLPGVDDGAVAASSARLPGVPLYCVPLNHSAIVNPRLVLEWYDPETGAFTNLAALDQVLTMYTGIIRPILKGNPPATDFSCPDGTDSNDSQPLMDILSSIKVGVHKGDVVSHTFGVADQTAGITVTFTHRFSEFDFSLRAPSGQVICVTNAQEIGGVSFTQTTNSISYTVQAPEAGQWELNIRAIDVPDQGEELNVCVLSQASPSQSPKLDADLSGEQIYLSWPSIFTGFSVEVRDSFSVATPWIETTNSPVQVSNRWTVSLPMTNNAAFYRLRKQL